MTSYVFSCFLLVLLICLTFLAFSVIFCSASCNCWVWFAWGGGSRTFVVGEETEEESRIIDDFNAKIRAGGHRRQFSQVTLISKVSCFPLLVKPCSLVLLLFARRCCWPSVWNKCFKCFKCFLSGQTFPLHLHVMIQTKQRNNRSVAILRRKLWQLPWDWKLWVKIGTNPFASPRTFEFVHSLDLIYLMFGKTIKASTWWRDSEMFWTLKCWENAKHQRVCQFVLKRYQKDPSCRKFTESPRPGC